MKQHKESGPRIRDLGIKSIALAGALLAAPESNAQTVPAQQTLPQNHIAEYMDATNPRINEDENRDRYEQRYHRVDIDENIENGAGRIVERGLDWGLRRFGGRFPREIDTQVTDDEVRGDGFRVVFALPLNPVQEGERR